MKSFFHKGVLKWSCKAVHYASFFECHPFSKCHDNNGTQIKNKNKWNNFLEEE